MESLGRLVGFVPIFLEDSGAMKADLPHGSSWCLLVELVEHTHLHVCDGNAAGCRSVGEKVAGHDDADRVRFGEAISCASLGGLELAVDALDHRCSEGGAPTPDSCQGRSVVLAEVWVVHQVVGHGRNAYQAHHFFVLNDLQGLGRVPLVHQTQLGAIAERSEQTAVRPCSVEERGAQQDRRLLGGSSLLVGEHPDAVHRGRDRAMRHHNAFGTARCA
mmetsp:Transcript_56287/g.119806  ORF Transcript_56287/g.119806 Transcript_56287/m.119806 type:complete len:218 (+) Transcript_56287:597-1250(+)